MTTLRIYDLEQHMLAFDLRDLLGLLAPRSLQASWTISMVRSAASGQDWFEATGEGGDKFEALAHEDTSISGTDLAALAEQTRQVIWGEFVGSLPSKSGDQWIIIRAVDSTFYEITTADEAVLNTIKSSFGDVRLADAPFV